MAESTGLLNLHTGNRITSSNLVLSAKRPCRNLCEAFLHQCRSENSQPQNVWLYIAQPSGVIIFIIDRFQPVRRSSAAGCAPSTSRGHPAAPGRILFYEYSCSASGKKNRQAPRPIWKSSQRSPSLPEYIQCKLLLRKRADVQTELVELGLVDLGRSVDHHVTALVVLREGDEVTDGLLAGE